MDKITKCELESELLKRLKLDPEVSAKYNAYNSGSYITAEYKDAVKAHDDLTRILYAVVDGTDIGAPSVYNSDPYDFFAVFPNGKNSETAYLVSRALLREHISEGKVRPVSRCVCTLYRLDKEYLDYYCTKKLKAR